MKDDELETISSRCEAIRTTIEILESSGKPTSQDIRRELSAIAGADDATAWVWYCAADPWTRCEIDTARLIHLDLASLIEKCPERSVRRGRLILYAKDLSTTIPEVVAPSAAIALNRFISKSSNRTGGRPKKYGVTEIGEFAAATWADLGGTPRAEKWKQWAETIFNLCSVKCPDDRDLERLLKARRRDRRR